MGLSISDIRAVFMLGGILDVHLMCKTDKWRDSVPEMFVELGREPVWSGGFIVWHFHEGCVKVNQL